MYICILPSHMHDTCTPCTYPPFLHVSIHLPFLHMYIYTHTHTHTHIYIYILPSYLHICTCILPSFKYIRT